MDARVLGNDRVVAYFEVAATGERLRQMPAHRAFWFGWYARHPDTHWYR